MRLNEDKDLVFCRGFQDCLDQKKDFLILLDPPSGVNSHAEVATSSVLGNDTVRLPGRTDSIKSAVWDRSTKRRLRMIGDLNPLKSIPG